MKTPKPEPVVVTTICSLCGEPWQAHGENPDTLDCIRLLKAKATQHPVVIYRDPTYPTYPTYPVWYGTTTVSPLPNYSQITCQSASGIYDMNGATTNTTYCTPTVAINATCAEVAA